MSSNSSDKEISQLLSWYVNGSLSATDREQVETSVQNSSGVAASLAWEQALRKAVKNDPSLACPPDLALSRVMQRIKANAKPVVQQQSLISMIKGLLSRITWSPAFAVACGVVAVQFGVIAQIWPGNSDQPVYSETRRVSSVPVKYDAFIRVSFRQDTRESDLRTLLRSIHAEVVAGPSQIGDYFLLVSNPEAQAALATLKSSSSIESVEIVDELPPKQ